MKDRVVRITFRCTEDVRKVMRETDNQWEDALGSAIRDMAEHVQSGTYSVMGGVPVQELLWYPDNDAEMDGVTIGTLEVLVADADSCSNDRCGLCRKYGEECTCGADESDDDTPTEPEEGDYVLHPAGPLGGCTSVSVDGQHRETFSPLGDVSADALALEWVKADMAAAEYFPNVWRMDDHGGYTLIERV